MKKSYIILICAVIIAVVVWYIERPDKPNAGDFTPFELYPHLVGSDMAKIEIEHLISGSTLTKSGSGWYVSELETELGKKIKEGEKKGEEAPGFPKFKADAERVEEVLEGLRKLEAGSLVSTNPSKQATYQVNNLAKQIRVYDASGKKLAGLYVGKSGPDMFTTYVRRDGEDEVYLVGGHIGAAIPADVMSWRDRKIWDAQPDIIIGISVVRRGKKGEESYSLSKDEQGVWHLAQPKEAILDGAKVEELISKIARPTAARFAHVFDKGEAGLDRPSLTLTITTTDGRVQTLAVGGEDKQGYLYARLEGNGGEVYLVGSDFGANIPADWAALMPDLEKKD